MLGETQYGKSERMATNVDSMRWMRVQQRGKVGLGRGWRRMRAARSQERVLWCPLC